MNDTADTTSVRFTFADHVPREEIDATLHLARLAAQSLFGPGRVALEGRHTFDPAVGAVDVNAGTEVGRALALIFGGYAEAEFGPAAVEMRRGGLPAAGRDEGSSHEQ
jgi:hypothetical protein